MRAQSHILCPGLPPLPFGHPDFVGDGLQVRAEDVLLRKEAHTHNPGSIDHTIKPCSRTTHQLLSTPHQVVPFLTAGVVPFPSAASNRRSSMLLVRR
jgi:hypothetical protein